MAFKSKYPSAQIEELLDKVASINTEGGYATILGIRHEEDSILYTLKGSSNELEGDRIIPTMNEIPTKITELENNDDVIVNENGYAVANGIYDIHNDIKFSLIHSEYENDGDYIIATTDYVDDAIANASIESGGGGSSNGSGSSSYTEVNHGTSDSTFELTPNTFHIWDEVTAMNLTLGAETSGIANEYIFQFTSGSIPTTLTLPDDIKFSEDLVIEANKIYQISILKGLGSVLSWDNGVALIENKVTVTDTTNGVVTFDYPVASDLVVTLRGDMSAQITFAKGQQTGSAGRTSKLEPYYIYDINVISDDKYIYVF